MYFLYQNPLKEIPLGQVIDWNYEKEMLIFTLFLQKEPTHLEIFSPQVFCRDFLAIITHPFVTA
jgi:hypothetical protein